jgi:hypothetical protein
MSGSFLLRPLPLRLCQRSQSIPGHSMNRPIAHRNCTQRFVKRDCRLVPIQHRPFQSTTITLDRDSCEAPQDRSANPQIARLGFDEQVFQIEPRLAEKCRKVVKVDRKGDRLSSQFSAYCRSPKRLRPRHSAVASTSCESRSYSAKSRISHRMTATSAGTAGRIAKLRNGILAITSWSLYNLTQLAKRSNSADQCAVDNFLLAFRHSHNGLCTKTPSSTKSGGCTKSPNARGSPTGKRPKGYGTDGDP